jgi:rhodanese-related sulfurtransferase
MDHPEPAYDDITPRDAHALLAAQGCYAVDVRTPWEFAAHRIPGAHLLPIQELNERHPEIPQQPDKPILIVCEHGIRSAHACQALSAHGWTKLLNVSGGMAAWLDERLAVARGEPAPAETVAGRAALAPQPARHSSPGVDESKATK